MFVHLVMLYFLRWLPSLSSFSRLSEGLYGLVAAGMSALLVARNARARLLVYGAFACTLFALFYLHTTHRLSVLELQRCKVDQKAAHTQLSAVIEYKEQMEHSLAAERSQHEDSAAALRSQQEEQDKLMHRTNLIENQYITLTNEYEKIKKSINLEQKLYNKCKNQQKEMAAVKTMLEDKVDTLAKTHDYLNRENERLRERIQSCEKINTNPKSFHVSINDESKNFSILIKESEDVYYVPISPNTKINNMNNNENNKQLEKTTKNDISVLNVHNINSNDSLQNKNGLKKSEIPHGVAPELSVEEANVNEKPAMANDGIKHDNIQVNLNPPNRYKHKLMQKKNNLEEDDDDTNGLLNESDRKFFDEVSLLIADSQLQDVDDPKNPGNANKRLNNEPNNNIKDEGKKENAEDVNISQNNGFREDDDDVDGYNDPHVEPGEDPGNKK